MLTKELSSFSGLFNLGQQYAKPDRLLIPCSAVQFARALCRTIGVVGTARRAVGVLSLPSEADTHWAMRVLVDCTILNGAIRQFLGVLWEALPQFHDLRIEGAGDKVLIASFTTRGYKNHTHDKSNDKCSHTFSQRSASQIMYL